MKFAVQTEVFRYIAARKQLASEITDHATELLGKHDTSP